MPEGLEAELWRRAAAPLTGRRIVGVRVDGRIAPRHADAVADVMIGARIEAVGRVGKVLTLGLAGRPTIGLHFGMTGRLVIDGHAPIERLSYASGRDDPAWDRLVVTTSPGADAPALRMNDPRRLGRVSVDPDLDSLGIDLLALRAGRVAEVHAAFARRSTAIKNVLLDQRVIAGLGNLLADELLWWAGIDPHRSADRVDLASTRSLVTVARRRLPIMLARGGSTEGVLSPAVRAACPPCPRDGEPLQRATIGARTAVWCPAHQR